MPCSVVSGAEASASEDRQRRLSGTLLAFTGFWGLSLKYRCVCLPVQVCVTAPIADSITWTSVPDPEGQSNRLLSFVPPVPRITLEVDGGSPDLLGFF